MTLDLSYHGPRVITVWPFPYYSMTYQSKALDQSHLSPGPTTIPIALARHSIAQGLLKYGAGPFAAGSWAYPGPESFRFRRAVCSFFMTGAVS